MKRNTGITLVALIITIVVMLILVAVSVNVIVKSNLIGVAEKAANGYKTAQDQEANGGTIEINGKKYDSIEGYLEGKESIPEIHNWQRTGDNLTCKCNQCTENGAKPEGRTLTIGQVIDYKDNGKGTSSIGEEESGIAQAKANGQTWAANIGVQTVKKDDDTEWVVLGAVDKNKDKNNTNETLLLTTKTPTNDTITMYGYKPYLYAVKEINRMCKEIYGKEAEGMTIEDVNNCLEYTAPAGMCGKYDSTTDKWTDYTLPKGTKISDLGSSYGNIWTDIQNNSYEDEDGTKKYFTPSCPEGSPDSSVLGDIEINGYYYYVSDDGTHLVNDADPTNTSNTTTTATRDLIFGTTEPYFYWLASRGVFAVSGCAYFGPGSVEGGSADSYVSSLFDSVGWSGSAWFSLRAVVSLSSDIPAVVE